jgi:hypothetical protein
MGAERPAVHVVEDLHWADRSTLDLLSFLATNLRDERVLLLLTYRADSVDRQDPLSRWLAELGRLHRPSGWTSTGCDDAQATELVTALTGRVPDPERLEDTLARSAGNPLFVEQLVLAGEQAGPLPATLHGLLESRVATLPREHVGCWAAGRDRPGGAGAAAGQGPRGRRRVRRGRPETGVEGPRHGAARRTTGSGFQHPAFREVVYAELLPGERRRLHRAAAEALTAEAAAEPEVVGEIARHWHLAGDLPRALESSVAAGHAYERLYAFADARDSYQRALDLLPAVPNELDAVDLRTRAGECASLSGDSTAAIRLLGEALAGATAPAHARGVAAASGVLPLPRRGRTCRGEPRSVRRSSSCLPGRPAPWRRGCTPGWRCWRWPGRGSTRPTPPARRRCGSPGDRGPPRGGPRTQRQGAGARHPRRPRRGRAAAPGVAGHRPGDRAAPRPRVGVREPGPRACPRGTDRRRPDPRTHRDRGAEPLRAGPSERQPAALQHRRRAAQVGSGRGGRGADRRCAGPAPARHHGGSVAARGCPLEHGPGRPHDCLGAL